MAGGVARFVLLGLMPVVAMTGNGRVIVLSVFESVKCAAGILITDADWLTAAFDDDDPSRLA